jgi:aminoglycoside phosphotransferase (APT) family kinase protein
MPEPLERDLDATREALIRWFGKRIPEGSGFEIHGMRGPSDTGFSSDTLLFELAYEREGAGRRERLVARIEPTSAFPVFPSYDVAMQFEVMRAVGRHGVPVPRMRWLEPDPSVLGAPFYVMDRSEGAVPSDRPPYHQAGWVYELRSEERAALWWSGLEAMARVHRIDPRHPDFDFLPRPPAGRSPIEGQLDSYERFLDWGCDRSRLPLVEDALTWLRAERPRREPLGLCWGDSRLANQIFRDLECVAVIDWEMVHLGNPVADLAWWTTLDRCFSEGIGLPRAAGFPGVDETVARWEELVGRKAEPFAYYELFAAFRFSVILARIAGRMKYYEQIPADHDLDRDNLASLVLARLLEEARAR